MEPHFCCLRSAKAVPAQEGRGFSKWRCGLTGEGRDQGERTSSASPAPSVSTIRVSL